MRNLLIKAAAHEARESWRLQFNYSEWNLWRFSLAPQFRCRWGTRGGALRGPPSQSRRPGPSLASLFLALSSFLSPRQM